MRCPLGGLHSRVLADLDVAVPTLADRDASEAFPLVNCSGTSLDGVFQRYATTFT